MPPRSAAGVSLAVRDAAHTITGSPRDYDPVLELVGDARFVLLGEASHGTHEFYRERAQITRRLVREKGFTAVAVEADWPDAYQVNRYVRGEGEAGQADQGLGGFRRFPTWMWRNTEVLEFIEWLRSYNDDLPAAAGPAGFYGLDLYSMYRSAQAVIQYLEKTDPEAAQRARYHYGCLEHFGEDSQAYGCAAAFNLSASCEDEVVRHLAEIRRRAAEYGSRDGRVAADEFFFAEQNARLVRNAEQYYRTMFRGRVSSWNLRDRHMAETLEHLVAHLDRHWGPSKLVLWSHNSHLGDARATEMGESGELNVGQLVRERFGGQSVLIGFTTRSGTVTAASNWDGPAERKRVRPALAGSYEELFHMAGCPQFFLALRGPGEAAEALREPRLERAIGVIYRPETERVSHYFHARLTDQFDGVLHFDQSRAVEPLEYTPSWVRDREWETFPAGV